MGSCQYCDGHHVVLYVGGITSYKYYEPRLVIEYRKLNFQTMSEIFPTLSIDEHGSFVWSQITLDLVFGYLQQNK